MNTNLLSIVRRIIADNGEGILGDPARLKAFFSDLAKDEPKPLRIAFGRGLEAGAYMALKTAPDAAERISRKAAIARRVRDEHGLDAALSGEALDILEAALYGTASAAQNTPPRYAPEMPPAQAPGYQGPPEYTAPPPPPVYADPAAASRQPNPPPGHQQSPWQKKESVPGRKVRHKFTTFWLVLCLIISGLGLINYRFGFFNTRKSLFGWIYKDNMAYTYFTAFVIPLLSQLLVTGLILVALVLLLRWKKVGFWLMIPRGVIYIIGIVLRGIQGNSLIMLLGGGLAVIGTFWLLRRKKARFWVMVLVCVVLVIVVFFIGYIGFLVYEVFGDYMDDDEAGDVIIVLAVLLHLFLIGSVDGVLRLRGSNGKSAWEQLE